MKKIFLLIGLLLLVSAIYSQENAQEQMSAPIDTITAQDIYKARYIVTVIVNEYYRECYNDSIPVSEFSGKPVGGIWWQQKGKYYWDVLNPIPNTGYLHRKMSAEGLIEFFNIKLGQ